MPANVFVYEVTAVPPFEFSVVFESGSNAERPNRLVGAPFRERFDALRAAFDTRFEHTFGTVRIELMIKYRSLQVCERAASRRRRRGSRRRRCRTF
jgi:hypothetical protein